MALPNNHVSFSIRDGAAIWDHDQVEEEKEGLPRTQEKRGEEEEEEE